MFALVRLCYLLWTTVLICSNLSISLASESNSSSVNSNQGSPYSTNKWISTNTSDQSDESFKYVANVSRAIKGGKGGEYHCRGNGGRCVPLGSCETLLVPKKCNKRKSKGNRQCCAKHKKGDCPVKKNPHCSQNGGFCVKNRRACAQGNILPEKCNCTGKKQGRCCVPQSPEMILHIVGPDAFYSFHTSPTMSWNDARQACIARGLDLYEPRDAVAVARYININILKKNYDGFFLFYWVGGQGNGTTPIWLSGDVIPNDGQWYNYYGYPGSCVSLRPMDPSPADGTVLTMLGCDGDQYQKPLCG